MTRNTKNNLYVLLFIIIFGGAVMFFSLIYPRLIDNSSPDLAVNNELFDLPKLDSTIFSKTDGTSHNLSVRFTLALEEESKDDVDSAALEAHITEVMSGLDYDVVSSEDGINYIKSQVADNLTGYIDPENFRGIYIRGIESDTMPFPDYDELDAYNGGGKASQRDIMDAFRRN